LHTKTFAHWRVYHGFRCVFIFVELRLHGGNVQRRAVERVMNITLLGRAAVIRIAPPDRSGVVDAW